MILGPREVTYTHFHLFCGLGGGARGFNRSRARLGHLKARLKCIGGVDADAAAIRDFTKAARCKGTVLDLFSYEQYVAFHGQEPPRGWQEATPDDLRRAARGQRPNIVFGSAPCKGFSGLLSENMSKTRRYQALNELALRGLWLALEAWGDDPPEFFLWENVPRIQTRGRSVLDQMEALFTRYGYVARETTHDCGELGELSQHRNRFLLVCRHAAKVAPFLYEPVKRPVRSVGALLDQFPLPNDDRTGPMHRMRALEWATWVRLAFVKAGSDWRSLNELQVADGVLRDYALVPETPYYNGALGVAPWQDPARTVTSSARPANGTFAVADPRFEAHGRSVQLGVRAWDAAAPTVTGQMWPGQGPFAVADPRPSRDVRFGGEGVNGWQETAPTIVGVRAPGQGKFSVADPRVGQTGNTPFNNIYRIVAWHDAARAITGDHGSGQVVADPRTTLGRGKGADGTYQSARHYGVVPWDAQAQAVTGSADHDNGMFSVADPRLGEHVGSGALSVADPRCELASSLPEPRQRLVCVIRALDGTWHRPFTTLELAALQGLVDPGEYLELHGGSDSAWRERIGNAVPPPAAEAIGSVMLTTLLLAETGETYTLSATPVWVHPIAIALSVSGGEEMR